MWTWGGEGSGEGSGVFGVRGSERYTRRTRVPTHITHTQVTHYTHTSPHPQPRTQRTYAPTPTHPPIQSSTQRGLRQRTPTEESYTHAPTRTSLSQVPFFPFVMIAGCIANGPSGEVEVASLFANPSLPTVWW